MKKDSTRKTVLIMLLLFQQKKQKTLKFLLLLKIHDSRVQNDFRKEKKHKNTKNCWIVKDASYYKQRLKQTKENHMEWNNVNHKSAAVTA